VLGRSDPEWGEAIVALVRPREPGAPPSADELRAHCAERLARFKVPKDIAFVAEPLPRTGSGKLLRRRLAADERT